jgi:hypothetical protein
MTIRRKMAEVVRKKHKILQLGGSSLGPAQLNSKLHIVVPPTTLGDSRRQTHRTPTHLVRQSKALTLRPTLGDPIQTKY